MNASSDSVIPPPVLLATWIGVGLLLRLFYPTPLLANVVAWWSGGAVITAGLGTLSWCLWQFRKHETALLPHRPDSKLIVAEAVWQYSHHVLAGLTTHRGPILTAANWSGQWPGLVGLLNLNGSLTKAGVAYSSLWSEDFQDDWFLNGLDRWLAENLG